MEFMTIEKSRQWLATFGAKIDDDRSLRMNWTRHEVHTFEAQLPSVPPMLGNFIERVVDWLPRGNARLLWLYDWTTYPPHAYRFFEAVRAGFGGRGPVIETPGCLFKADTGDINQEFSEEPETFGLVGLSLLVVNFDWRAFIVAQDGTSLIDFGDECVSLSTSESTQFEDARALLNRFNLNYKHVR